MEGEEIEWITRQLTLAVKGSERHGEDMDRGEEFNKKKIILGARVERYSRFFSEKLFSVWKDITEYTFNSMLGYIFPIPPAPIYSSVVANMEIFT